MDHLVIVDGHHLMHRAYWAIPRTLKTSAGLQVNMVFGIASMVLQILEKEQPSHLLFCFDEGDETFRHAAYEEYKGGRAQTPDDFYAQIPLAHRFFGALGDRSVSSTEHEADDFAASYADAAARADIRSTIVTGDKDLYQLVSDRIRVAIPHKGYRAQEYIGPEEVRAKFGVPPSAFAAYKGLVGDSSDNFQGVKGIGPKAATELLQRYGSIAAIYDHLPEIRPSVRAKLEAGKDQAFFCERMANLVRTLPLPITLPDLALTGLSSEPLTALFSELEFALLLRRLTQFLSSPFGARCFRASSGVGETPRKGSSLEPLQMSLL